MILYYRKTEEILFLIKILNKIKATAQLEICKKMFNFDVIFSGCCCEQGDDRSNQEAAGGHQRTDAAKASSQQGARRLPVQGRI